MNLLAETPFSLYIESKSYANFNFFLLMLFWTHSNQTFTISTETAVVKSNVLHITNQLICYQSLVYCCPFLPSWYTFFMWLSGHYTLLVSSPTFFSPSQSPSFFLFFSQTINSRIPQGLPFLSILLFCWFHLGHGFKCHIYMEDFTGIPKPIAFSWTLHSYIQMLSWVLYLDL